MARFLKHTACNVCGSSDALAHYEDGSTYCFSHGRSTKKAHISPYVTSSRQQDDAEMQRKPMCLPDDATQDYPPQALAWAEKYEIGVELLLRNKVYYSAARNQLIFSFLGGAGELLAYQARNLSAESKARRYYTQGDINDILPIYHTILSRRAGSGTISSQEAARRLVLVEDCLSAIKVASIEALERDAMPLLGSTLSLLKLTRLRAFYDVLDVFLDPDMWHHSLPIVRQAQLLGFKARAIKADKDPKEISREGLTALLS